MALDYAQRQRDPSKHLMGFGIVLALHLLLAWALAHGLGKRMVEVMRAPIVTKIIEELRPPPEPEKPLPPPPKLAPPVPNLMPPPDVRLSPLPDPLPLPKPPPPAPPPPPPPTAQPMQAAPTITPESVPQPRPRPAPVTATNAAQSAEEVYISELRAYLISIKRYPTSREARQLRPQGTVKIWIEIDRTGHLLGAGVEVSAGTLLLDNEALRTVRNGRYPAFPTEAFAGQASRRFVIPIEYQHAEGG